LHVLEKNAFLSIYWLISGSGIKKYIYIYIYTDFFCSYEFLPTPELELFMVEFLPTELFGVEFLPTPELELFEIEYSLAPESKIL